MSWTLLEWDSSAHSFSIENQFFIGWKNGIFIKSVHHRYSKSKLESNSDTWERKCSHEVLCSYRAVNEQLNNIGIIVSRKWMRTLCRSEMDVLFQMSLATGTYITCGISNTNVAYVSLCKFVKKKKKKKAQTHNNYLLYWFNWQSRGHSGLSQQYTEKKWFTAFSVASPTQKHAREKAGNHRGRHYVSLFFL